MGVNCVIQVTHLGMTYTWIRYSITPLGGHITLQYRHDVERSIVDDRRPERVLRHDWR